MSTLIGLKEDLRRKVRESSLSGSEVLRRLDKAVTRLEEFAHIMTPMLDAVQRLDQSSKTLDQALSQVRDQAQLSREAVSIVRDLAAPRDIRSHIKNMERGTFLLNYYAKNQNLEESNDFAEKIKVALSAGYENCVRFIEEQIGKYNEIYGVGKIAQDNAAQIDMVETIKGLIEFAKIKAPQFWQGYVRLRAALLLRYISVGNKLQEPYVKGTHYIIEMLKEFLVALSVEHDFLSWILDTQAVQDYLGEVCDSSFSYLSSQTEQFISKKASIIIYLDILTHFSNSLPEIERLLGKSAKYFTASKLQTTLMQRCQLWYRDYIQYIQSSKIEVSDSVHEMSTALANELKIVMKFAEGLAVAKLEQSIAHLVTTLVDTFRVKIKQFMAKQQGLCHLFMINNLSYWIAALQDIDFQAVEDTMTRIEKEMLSEIEEYVKNTWSKLMPILSDNPTVIEFKKPGVLARWSRKAVKNKLNSFNNVFPEILNYHKGLSVYSREIIQLLRRKQTNLIIPEYKEFLKRYMAVDFTTRREKYMLFPIETVEQGLGNMYVLRKA
jgi:uncharacterized UPF0160 family protein